MRHGTAQSYRVFVRNWWRWERRPGQYLDGPAPQTLVPDPGARKTTIATGCTEDEARGLAQAYNRTHAPGPLSRKAEFEEVTR
jgi:hypothetical protein